MFRLGHGVIQIEISPEQQEIVVDTALMKFYDYHFDGNIEEYLIVSITPTDVANGYITLLEEIHAISHILPLDSDSTMTDSASMFSVKYQFYLNDFYSGTGIFGGELSSIDSLRSYLATASRTLTPLTSFNFNRKTNRIYFNEPLSSVKLRAPSLAIKVYKKIDPEEFPDVWNDEFLKDFATALMKKQWSSNLRKFGNVSLPGGVTLNADAIYAEAVQEIADLETKLINDLQSPMQFFIG